LISAIRALRPATSCMNAKCFVDTNVLIYAHDMSAGFKHQRALVLVEDLWVTGNGVLSTQVLQEFCANARREPTKPLSLDDTHRIIREYVAWEVVVNTPTSVLDALRIEARYKVSFWDALILAAAGHAGAETVYSEDFSHGQQYGSVRVVNPFAA